ncbi:uncharacterized protein LOC102805014 [Saccoglossus kowalevskii]|uniref:Uncharacterized protein PF11_0207-like n=1 Tax=Saccoglossus kowalevskii TaxID=10224 RepID=A0ABM0MEA8_SACKO|nr:PREDICTED: uncharacterized protein PF11_0207-like [Saccoglossus kowalevskii]
MDVMNHREEVHLQDDDKQEEKTMIFLNDDRNHDVITNLKPKMMMDKKNNDKSDSDEEHHKDENGCHGDDDCNSEFAASALGQPATADVKGKCDSDVSMVTDGCCDSSHSTSSSSVRSEELHDDGDDDEMHCGNASSHEDMQMNYDDVREDVRGSDRSSCSQASKESLDVHRMDENEQRHLEEKESFSASNNDMFNEEEIYVNVEDNLSTKHHAQDNSRIKNKFTFNNSFPSESRTPKNYHNGCVPSSESRIPQPVQRRSLSSRFRRCASVSSEGWNRGSVDSLSARQRSPIEQPDWVVFEKDEGKLMNAQRCLLARHEFAATHYLYGTKSNTVRQKDVGRCSSLRSLIDMRSDSEPVQKSTLKRRRSLKSPCIERRSPEAILTSPDLRHEKSEMKYSEMKCTDLRATSPECKTKSPDMTHKNLDLKRMELKKSKSLEKSPFGNPMDSNPYGASVPYMTPLQQKERQVKELNRKVRELEELLENKDEEITYLKEEHKIELETFFADKETEFESLKEEIEKQNDLLKDKNEKVIQELKDEIQMLEKVKNDEICRRMDTEKSLIERQTIIEKLEHTMKKMEVEYKDREHLHQHRYLEMYKKGQLAQEMEMEENMILEAAKNPQNKNVKDLLRKLEKTQIELEKLKESRRKEIYEEAPHIKSDPEAIVELLSSSFYYYLIGRDAKTNLRAIMSILNYSEVQKRTILNSLKKKEK